MDAIAGTELDHGAVDVGLDGGGITYGGFEAGSLSGWIATGPRLE